MSQFNETNPHVFLLKVEQDLAAQIEKSRKRNGERSSVAAVRELIKRGLAAEQAV
jgi:hypothetical protein